MANNGPYVSRTNKRGMKPIAPTGGDDIARDGYSIRHRQPLEAKRHYHTWDGERDYPAHSVKTVEEARFESYLKD